MEAKESEYSPQAEIGTRVLQHSIKVRIEEILRDELTDRVALPPPDPE